MIRKGNWQPLRPLKDYLEAPDQCGIYEIGFRRNVYIADQKTAFGLHAAGYPSNFMPMYVGKHERSIQKRLGEHFIGINARGRRRTGGKASKSIKQYYLELLPELERMRARIPPELQFPLDGLYFTCIPVSDPKRFEAAVRLRHFDYPWNRRDEHSACAEAQGKQSADFQYIYREHAFRIVG